MSLQALRPKRGNVPSHADVLASLPIVEAGSGDEACHDELARTSTTGQSRCLFVLCVMAAVAYIVFFCREWL